MTTRFFAKNQNGDSNFLSGGAALLLHLFVGEILNDKGEVVASRHFGIMSEAEFRRAMEHIKKEFPDAIVLDIIELTGN
jgi:hypothetical protein